MQCATNTTFQLSVICPIIWITATINKFKACRSSRLCWILYDPSGTKWGRVYDVPVEFWGRCQERKTQIVMAEALAVVMMLLDGLHCFEGHAMTAYVDNLAALCGLVVDYSGIGDLSSIYLAVARRLGQLDIASWYEWVPSDSNVADGGSRVGISDPCAAKLETQLSQGIFPQNSLGLLSFSACAWDSWWINGHS